MRQRPPQLRTARLRRHHSAPDLERVASLLLTDERSSAHFAHLKGARIVYLWKRTGGARNGRAVYGKCSQPSGLLSHFAEADFIIWLAADHLRDMVTKVRAEDNVAGGITGIKVTAGPGGGLVNDEFAEKVETHLGESLGLTRTVIGATHWQVEAMVFHELEHIGIEETDDGAERLVLKPHDLEIFRSEVERYGPWQADIAEAAESFRQMPLWEQGVENA